MLPYYFNTLFDANQQGPQIERTGRTVVPPSRFEATIHDIPILTPTMPILFTNTKFNRSCIRHKIPDLINENYLPEIVMTKIDTHSFKGFSQYAKNYIVNNYETNCNINCHICNKP